MASFFSDVNQDTYNNTKAKLDQMVQAGQISPAQEADALKALGYAQIGAPEAPPGSALGTQNLNQQLGNGANNLTPPPNLQAALGDPNTYKMLQMHLGALANQAYRPMSEQAGVNALGNQLSAFQGANNALGSMYGPGAKMDLQGMAKSPLPQGMTSIGAPNRNDIGLDANTIQMALDKLKRGQ